MARLVPAFGGALTLAGTLASAQAMAAPISITSFNISTAAAIGAELDQDFEESTAYGARSLTSQKRETISTSLLNWQDTGSGAVFDFDFAHQTSGAQGPYAVVFSSLVFAVGTSDVSYALSGAYSMYGSTHRIAAEVSLYDLAGRVSLYRDLGISDNTDNESFSLGVVGDADYLNDTYGSLTGTLQASLSYLFLLQYSIASFSSTENGASASGCLTLSFNGAVGDGQCGIGNSVPEPGSLALVVLALTGIGTLRRRSR